MGSHTRVHSIYGEVIPVVIQLLDKRVEKAQKVQVVQDVVGVMVLAPSILTRLQGGSSAEIVLGALEVIAVILAVASAYTEIRHRKADGRRIDLSNLFVGCVLMLEWWQHSTESGKLVGPILITGLLALFLSVFRPWIESRRGGFRSLIIDDEGFMLRSSPFRRLKLAWRDIGRLEVTEKKVTVHLLDGSTRALPTRRYRNADEIVAGLKEGLARGALANRLTPPTEPV